MRNKTLVIVTIFLIILNSNIHAGTLDKRGRDSFKWGLTERFRLVSWDNAVYLDKSRETTNTFTRHQTCIWFDWKLLRNLRWYAKFTNEFRYYFRPEKDFTIHEIFPDNLFLQLKLSGILPVTITAGRQNIILGEGFVVMDAHPLDGSRSIYFNGVRLDCKPAADHIITMFYVKQPVIDDWLPMINPQNQTIIEQPEQGMGVYYKGKGFNLNWEGYVILKNRLKTKDYPISTQSRTWGGRFIIPVNKNIHLTAEGAFQQGEQGDYNISAWGGYTHLDFSIGETIPCLKKLTLGAIALSGDDPGTFTNEGWDPLFSRWPKWSESYIYTLIPEMGGKVAYWSNLSSLNSSLEFKLTQKIRLKLTYHSLKSFYNLAFISSRKYGLGKYRGDLLIARSTFQINQHFKGHVLLEIFKPGNFYSPEDDSYNWFRFELMYTL